MTNISKINCENNRGRGGLFWGLAVGFLCVFCGVGCGREEQIDPAIENLGRATGPVEPMKQAEMKEAMMKRPMGGAEVPEGSGKVHRGTVLETIDVPNYTYIRFRTAAAEELWAAVPLTDQVKKDQPITLVESLVMKDFPSRSLGRTFPSIIFGVVGEAGEGANPDAGKTPTSAADAGPVKGHTEKPQLPPGHPPINAR